MNTSKKLFLTAFSFISYSVTAQQSTEFSYGKNLLSLSPVQLSERTPTGIGLQYERFFSSSNKFSLYLPLAYSFGHADPCDPTIRARVFYAYPGVKFYPAGYQHKITYAVGPSLAFSKGTTNCNCDEVETLVSDAKPKDYKPVTQMGVLINNSVNIQATEHLYFGSELGMGASYINTLGGKDIGNDLMVQLNVKVGWRM